MIRNAVYWILVCASMVGISGCVTTRSQLRLEAKGGDGNVGSQPPPQAMAVIEKQEAEERHRELLGKVETLEHEIQQLRSQQTSLTRAGDKETEDLKVRMKLFEEALYKFEQSLAQVRMDLDEVRVKSAPTKELTNKTGKGLDRAKGEDKTKKNDPFGEAEDAFSKKDYRQAILNYQKYREKNPKGKNYADATLKIGVSFSELKMKSEARAFLQEVITKFPKTPAGKTAAQKLKAIE